MDFFSTAEIQERKAGESYAMKHEVHRTAN
jgi:hypothetical protein